MSTALLNVAVLDSTTDAPTATVKNWVTAVNIQMNRDYFRGGVKSGIVRVTYYAKGQTPPPGYWWIAIVDNTDMAGALGYHDLTPEGLPLGKVFVKTARQAGLQPSVVLSHELLEMLGDPFINEVVSDHVNPNRFWAKEVCDAVEACTYPILLPVPIVIPAPIVPTPPVSVLVSDFVLQNYWNTTALTGPWSFKNCLSGPVPALAPGGYMGFTENGVWSQVTKYNTPPGSPARAADVVEKRIDGPFNKRRLLRLVPRASWVRSTTTKVG